MARDPYFPASELPNLDALTEEDLAMVRADAENLVAYCSHRIRAIQYRLEGRIVAAQREEESMQIIYDSLPEWATW